MPSRAAEHSGIVTFLTDFGLEDGYAGVMKGVVLAQFPDATLVDVSHQVPPFNLRAAALILESAFPHFPKGTIHVVVVDPGVGSSRPHLIVHAAGHIFIGPDNGILGRIAKLDKGQVCRIDPARLGSQRVSNTFHGRDIYALAAGKLLAGVESITFSRPTDDYGVLEIPQPREVHEVIEGEVIYVDRFGNLVTNFREPHLCSVSSMSMGSTHIGKAQNYSQLARGVPGVILDSWGYYEIALREASAAKHLGVGLGEKVFIIRPSLESCKKEKV